MGCCCRGMMNGRVLKGWEMCPSDLSCVTINAVNYRQLLSGASSSS